MSTVVIWRPEPLTARLTAAAVPARRDAARLAATSAAWNRVGRSVRVVGESVVALDPLAPILEKGAEPHMIESKHKVLKLADGSFVSGSIQHPGTPAQPFLRPLLPLWPTLYRRHAAGAFRGI